MLKRAALVVVLLAMVAGCGSAGPTQVSENFWGALVDGDVEKARKYATPETAANITASEGGEGEFSFGAEQIDGETAKIATTLVNKDDGMSMTIELETVLVRNSGEWLVDVDRTMMSMFGGAMGAMMEEMGDVTQEGMEQMGQEMAARGAKGSN